MASLPSLYFTSSLSFLLRPRHNWSFAFLHESPRNPPRSRISSRRRSVVSLSFSTSYRFSIDHEDEDEHVTEDFSFDEAVALFNQRAYYDCHDILEMLWNRAQDLPELSFMAFFSAPSDFIISSIGLNHRGAMMELGEGLCKLRKMEFKSGPFHTFEREISAVLDFVYQTQIELAACDDNVCVTMDRSERSYQLLGGYAAGEHLYDLGREVDGTTCIVFRPPRSHADPLRVKLPTLAATEEQLLALDYR